MELFHFKSSNDGWITLSNVQTIDKYFSWEVWWYISDYHDEDEEVDFQYGTSAWTSDPHTGSGAVIAIVSRSVRNILFLLLFL